jgi:hypothetical protein
MDPITLTTSFNQDLMQSSLKYNATVNNYSSSVVNENDYFEDILNLVNLYVNERIGMVLFIIGLLFNILSFGYFQFSRSFCDTSMRHYFSVLSVSDTLRLSEWLFTYLIVNKNIIFLNTMVCKVFLFITIASAHISIWLLVFLSIERYVIMQFPFKGKQFYTKKTSLRILSLVVIALIIFDLPYFSPNFIIGYRIFYEVQLFICIPTEKFKLYMFFNNILFYSIIPFLLILLFNSLLIIRLARQKKEFYSMTNQNENHHSNVKRERQFKERTILLMVVTFFLVLTVSPR